MLSFNAFTQIFGFELIYVVTKVTPSCMMCLSFTVYPNSFLGNYSQTRIKCSRPISSLRGLQGHKIFADAIIKILIATKSIIGKNCHDQLFINEVVKIFTFQFDESVTKFYVVKVLLILMKFS